MPPAFSDRISALLERTGLASPFLVMDVAAVVSRYLGSSTGSAFPDGPAH